RLELRYPRVRLRGVGDAPVLGLDDVLDGVDAKAVDPQVEPEPGDLFELAPHDLVPVIQVGHLAREEPQVTGAVRTPVPGRAASGAAPSGRSVRPYVVVAVRGIARGSCLEPGMGARRVVG